MAPREHLAPKDNLPSATNLIKTNNTNNAGQSKHTYLRARQTLNDCNEKNCESVTAKRSVRWNMNLIGNNSRNHNTTDVTTRSCLKEQTSSLNIDHNTYKQPEIQERRIHFSRREHPKEKDGKSSFSKPQLDKTTSNKSKSINSTTKQTTHTLKPIKGVNKNSCKIRSLKSSDIKLPVIGNPSTKQRQEIHSPRCSHNKHKLDLNSNKNGINLEHISDSIYTNVFDDKNKTPDSNVDRQPGNRSVDRKKAEIKKIDKLPVITLSDKRTNPVMEQPAQSDKLPVTTELNKRDKFPAISKCDKFPAIRQPERSTTCYLAKTDRSKRFKSKLPVRIRCRNKTNDNNSSTGGNSSNSRILEDSTGTHTNTNTMDGSNNSSSGKRVSGLHEALVEFTPLSTDDASLDANERRLSQLRERTSVDTDGNPRKDKKLQMLREMSVLPEEDVTKTAFFINKRWNDLKTRIDTMTAGKQTQAPTVPGLVALITGLHGLNPGARAKAQARLLLPESMQKNAELNPEQQGNRLLQEDNEMSEEVKFSIQYTASQLDQQKKYKSSIPEVIKDGVGRWEQKSRKSTASTATPIMPDITELTDQDSHPTLLDDMLGGPLGGPLGGRTRRQYMTRMKFNERITHSLPLAESINVATVLEDFSDKLELLGESFRMDFTNDSKLMENIKQRSLYRDNRLPSTQQDTDGRSVTSLDYEVIDEYVLSNMHYQGTDTNKAHGRRNNIVGVPGNEDNSERKESERKESERKESERKESVRRESIRLDSERRDSERRDSERRNSERRKLLDAMLSEINEMIRSSSTTDHLGKIKRDCTFVKETMVGLFVKLLQDSKLKTLFDAVSVEQEIVNEVDTMTKRVNVTNDAMEMNTLEAIMLKRTLKYQIKVHNKRMWTLSDECQEKRDFSNLEKKMHAKIAKMEVSQNRAIRKANEKKLAKQLTSIKQNIVTEHTTHQSMCTYLTRATERLEKQTSDWMEKYASDREFIEQEMCDMNLNLHQMKERRDDIMLVFNDYMQVCKDQDRMRVNEEMKLELLALKHRKATMIQALYRGTLSRRAFYR